MLKRETQPFSHIGALLYKNSSQLTQKRHFSCQWLGATGSWTSHSAMGSEPSTEWLLAQELCSVDLTPDLQCLFSLKWYLSAQDCLLQWSSGSVAFQFAQRTLILGRRTGQIPIHDPGLPAYVEDPEKRQFPAGSPPFTSICGNKPYWC